MSGWGLSIIGLESTIEVLESLYFAFDDDVTYVAGPTVEYAVYVDQGTSKMEARPFARPAAERVQANLGIYIEEFLEGAVLEADEDAIVRSAALAVESEMKRIITAKDAVDTGTMRASVSIEKVT